MRFAMKEIEEDISEEQYSASAEAAYNFVEGDIIPSIIEFEWNNDPEYVPGSAVLQIFIKMIQIMGQMGYEPDELKEFIDENHDMYMNDTIH